MHRIHAVLRVITLSLGLHAMRYIRCSRSRTGPHHTVNRAWWWIWSRAGAHNGPWGQTCPRRGTRMGHSTCCVWRGGHLPNWWERPPHSLRKKTTCQNLNGWTIHTYLMIYLTIHITSLQSSSWERTPQAARPRQCKHTNEIGSAKLRSYSEPLNRAFMNLNSLRYRFVAVKTHWNAINSTTSFKIACDRKWHTDIRWRPHYIYIFRKFMYRGSNVRQDRERENRFWRTIWFYHGFHKTGGHHVQRQNQSLS